MYKKADLTEFKQLLLAIRARIRGDVEALKGSALNRDRAQNDSHSPTHLADLGSDAYDQDFSLRVVESDESLLGEINDALSRVEEGTFGVCPDCLEDGKTPAKSRIPKARLRAVPYAGYCVEHELRREEFA